MQRRALLRGLMMMGVPATAAAVAGAAVKSTQYVRETGEHSLETCKQQLEDLRERMDRSEVSTKKALRTLLALTALSLGMDVSALL